MKKALYEDDAVAYWPYYSTFFVFGILLYVMTLSCVSLGIWQLFIVPTANIILLVLLGLLLIFSILMIVLVSKLRDQKIVIDRNGIFIYRRPSKSILHISWSDVDEIRWKKDSYYGLESFIAICAPSNSENHPHNSKPNCIRISVSNVDPFKVKQMIPEAIKTVDTK